MTNLSYHRRCPHCRHSMSDHNKTGQCSGCSRCDPNDPQLTGNMRNHNYMPCECQLEVKVGA